MTSDNWEQLVTQSVQDYITMGLREIEPNPTDDDITKHVDECCRTMPVPLECNADVADHLGKYLDSIGAKGTAFALRMTTVAILAKLAEQGKLP